MGGCAGGVGFVGVEVVVGVGMALEGEVFVAEGAQVDGEGAGGGGAVGESAGEEGVVGWGCGWFRWWRGGAGGVAGGKCAVVGARKGGW